MGNTSVGIVHGARRLIIFDLGGPTGRLVRAPLPTMASSHDASRKLLSCLRRFADGEVKHQWSRRGRHTRGPQSLTGASANNKFAQEGGR